MKLAEKILNICKGILEYNVDPKVSVPEEDSSIWHIGTDRKKYRMKFAVGKSRLEVEREAQQVLREPVRYSKHVGDSIAGDFRKAANENEDYDPNPYVGYVIDMREGVAVANKMRQKEVIKQIREMGLHCDRTPDGEFRIVPRGGNETQAYYTDDPDDAIATARHMLSTKKDREEIAATIRGERSNYGWE